MEERKIELRNLKLKDYKSLKESMLEVYAAIGGDYWKESAIRKLLKIFPEGQLCICRQNRKSAAKGCLTLPSAW